MAVGGDHDGLRARLQLYDVLEYPIRPCGHITEHNTMPVQDRLNVNMISAVLI